MYLFSDDFFITTTGYLYSHFCMTSPHTAKLDHVLETSSYSSYKLDLGRTETTGKLIPNFTLHFTHGLFLISVYTMKILCISLNPLNTKLNSICHLLALLGAHLILHVSRIRVNCILKNQQNMYVKLCFACLLQIVD